MNAMKEREIIQAINNMCVESLSPEVFDKWEEVKFNLQLTRKDLKIMDIIESAELLRNKMNLDSLFPAVAVVAFDLGLEDLLIGNEDQEYYDLIIAIATLFEYEHQNTTWEDHESTWEESLHDHTRKMIKIHNIPTRNS